MPSAPTRNGFALLDTLVALLLFAVALLGNCATLAQGMRALQSAVLQDTAVDLAADLAEDLHGLGDDESIDTAVADWRERVRSALPVHAASDFAQVQLLAPPEATATSRYDLLLRWQDQANGGPRELRLPAIAREAP